MLCNVVGVAKCKNFVLGRPDTRVGKKEKTFREHDQGSNTSLLMQGRKRDVGCGGLLGGWGVLACNMHGAGFS